MPTERDKDFPELLIIDFPGGCPMVVDPAKPHLGGNMRGGDSATEYPLTLWPWLKERYHPRAVMDIGCAEGHALRWFRDHGCAVIGVEGLRQNAKRCGLPVIVHDLTTGPILTEGVDLIWCSDVVEHIEERFLGYLLPTLAQAPVLALAHGTEENAISGWHHVNNKSEEYWIEKLATVGMVHDRDASAESRKVASSGWWAHSGNLFVRGK